MNPDEVRSHARKGAAWTLIISAIAFPLSYARYILLGRVGHTTEVLGTFALLLLFLNAIYTFFFPGGRNVFPTYFPKLSSEEGRSGLVSGFLYLVAAAAAAGLILALLRPELFDVLLQQRVDARTRTVLLFLIPFALFSALANSIVTGNLSFVWASLLLRIQLVLVTLVAVVMYVTASASMIADAVLWLGGAMVVGAVVNLCVSSWLLRRWVRVRWRPRFPSGCLKFTMFTYFDTIMVWINNAIDRFFVAVYFSVAQLGIYFALFEVARIVPLAVQQVEHLLLATFSKLLGGDAEDSVVSGYRRVSRITVGIYALVSVTVIFLSRPLASIFGATYVEHHHYLICLAVVVNIDSLRTINGITLMAYERMPSVFVSNVLQNIIQFGVTLALIEPMGVYGVIVGKGAGHVACAIALFVATARVGKTRKLLPPLVYVLSQVVVFAAAWVAYRYEDRGIGVSALLVMVGWAVIWLGGGFSIDDIRALIPWRRRSAGTGP
ncbi:MAG: oligosaccharide flippase family protein [Phycisphaerae bacterium]